MGNQQLNGQDIHLQEVRLGEWEDEQGFQHWEQELEAEK